MLEERGMTNTTRQLFECSKLELVHYRKPYNCQYQYGCVLCTAARTWMDLGLALVAGNFIKYVKYCRAPRYWQESSSSFFLNPHWYPGRRRGGGGMFK